MPHCISLLQCPTVFLCYNILYSQQYNVSFPIFRLLLTFHICFDSVLFHFNFQVSNYPKFLRPMPAPLYFFATIFFIPSNKTSPSHNFHICFDSVLFHFNFQVSNYPKFPRPMPHCISLLQYSSFPAI